MVNELYKGMYLVLNPIGPKDTGTYWDSQKYGLMPVFRHICNGFKIVNGKTKCFYCLIMYQEFLRSKALTYCPVCLRVCLFVRDAFSQS